MDTRQYIIFILSVFTDEALQVRDVWRVRLRKRWKSSHVEGKYTALGIRTVLEYRDHTRRYSAWKGNEGADVKQGKLARNTLNSIP